MQFDSCDVERHFAILAPHRAFQCPALRYAIFSASARHISRRKHLSMKSKMPMQGTRPDIGSEVALEYQSLCISHLMALSGDPLEVQDENLLAASVILRFYEELDGRSDIPSTTGTKLTAVQSPTRRSRRRNPFQRHTILPYSSSRASSPRAQLPQRSFLGRGTAEGPHSIH